MISIRDQIVEEALTWLDTPYQHQAKVKHVGVDCAMFVVGVAQNVGLLSHSEIMPVYSPEWHLHNREERLIQILEDFNCKEINTSDALPGDIFTFKFGRCASHLAFILPDNYILHARVDTRKVVKHLLSGDFKLRIHSAYKLPGV